MSSKNISPGTFMAEVSDTFTGGCSGTGRLKMGGFGNIIGMTIEPLDFESEDFSEGNSGNSEERSLDKPQKPLKKSNFFIVVLEFVVKQVHVYMSKN